MNRTLRNIARLPARTLQSLLRGLTPAYWVQLKANREVCKWLAGDRYEQLAAIPGTSSARENRLLAYLAKHAPTGGCIVEIGAFKGKSAAWLVEAAEHREDRPAIVSIDPHLGGTWETFCHIVESFRLKQRGLEVHRAFSHDVGLTWNRPISLLWIDGGHEYEDVIHDIEDFVPHVVPGGWIVFDDVHGGQYPGVERAVRERMHQRPGYKNIGPIKHFELFRRDLQSTKSAA